MGPDRRPDRLAALRRALDQAGIDALLVSHLPNIRYLSGFTGDAGLLLVDRARVVLVTDRRYALQAPEEIHGLAEVEIGNQTWELVKEVLHPAGPEPVGFEAEYLSVHSADRLRAATTAPVTATMGLVEALRVSKDPGEVAAIREAVTVALDAFEALLPTLRVGETERTIAARLDGALRHHGSLPSPFPAIVASGPRSALPHAQPTERAVRPGDLLLLDFGASVDGYCADLTRTVVVGARADGRQRDVYDAVRSAQGEAVAGLRAGITGREADGLARAVMVARGVGDFFTHSLGHGIGLQVHEAPRLAPVNEEALPAGAVVTVEPAAYLEGWGGVRLEDDAVLTAGGVDLLSGGAPPLVEIP
jgi:Xaa-Pro aminopeptidase